jgi:hypothetical protein
MVGMARIFLVDTSIHVVRYGIIYEYIHFWLHGILTSHSVNAHQLKSKV